MHEEQFNQQLKKLHAEPSPEWVNQTRRRLEVLIDQDTAPAAAWSDSVGIAPQPSGNNLFINFVRMTRHQWAVLGVVAFVTLGVVGAAALATTANRSTAKVVALSDLEASEVLSKMAANNAGANLNNIAAGDSAGGSRLMAESTGMPAPAADTSRSLLYAPSQPQFSYNYSKFESRNGPAASKCKIYGEANTGNSGENWSYYDKAAGKTYFKNISYDQAGALTSYSLGSYSATANESYEYRGGSFAVKVKYINSQPVQTLVEPRPAVSDDTGAGTSGSAGAPTPSTTVAPDAPISSEVAPDKDVFGPDAKVTKVTEANGTEYYNVEYSYDLSCNLELLAASTTGSGQSTNKAIAVNKVSTSNYQILESNVYLDAVGEANLLNYSKSTNESRDTDFASVASNFNFDRNVTVREITIDGADYSGEKQLQNQIDYLKNNSVSVLVSNDATFKTGSTYIQAASLEKDKNYSYVYERAFYPAGAKGDAEFNQVNASSPSNYSSPVASTHLSGGTNGEQSVSISTYKSSDALDKVLSTSYNFGTDKADKAESTIQITIGGQPVSVKQTIFTVNYTIPKAIDSRELSIYPGNCTGENCVSKTVIISFSYNGFNYVITSYGNVDMTKLNLKELRSTNAAERTELENLIKTAQANDAARAEPAVLY